MNASRLVNAAPENMAKLLLVAWPLKNYLVFGHFIYSSWSG